MLTIIANFFSIPEGIEVNGKHDDTCTPDNSGTSENSDNTVIFLPYKDQHRSINGSLDRSIDVSLDKSLGLYYIVLMNFSLNVFITLLQLLLKLV